MNQPLTEYLKNKEIRNNSRYRISPEGIGYVLAESVLISDK
jgi:hypothetical protein